MHGVAQIQVAYTTFLKMSPKDVTKNYEKLVQICNNVYIRQIFHIHL